MKISKKFLILSLMMTLISSAAFAAGNTQVGQNSATDCAAAASQQGKGVAAQGSGQPQQPASGDTTSGSTN